jgi:hypothetical protein
MPEARFMGTSLLGFSVNGINPVLRVGLNLTVNIPNLYTTSYIPAIVTMTSVSRSRTHLPSAPVVTKSRTGR